MTDNGFKQIKPILKDMYESTRVKPKRISKCLTKYAAIKSDKAKKIPVPKA